MRLAMLEGGGAIMQRIGERAATLARKALVERQRKLTTLAAGLRHEEDEALDGTRPDQLDRGSDLELHEVLESLQAAEARELKEIDAALQRIAAGTYGRCERCGAPVGDLRLRAVPQARTCMLCAAQAR
jgi:RNA polymerase-binding transcription factor DksA